jgi:hypothetical protein
LKSNDTAEKGVGNSPKKDLRKTFKRLVERCIEGKFDDGNKAIFKIIARLDTENAHYTTTCKCLWTRKEMHSKLDISMET